MGRLDNRHNGARKRQCQAGRSGGGVDVEQLTGVKCLSGRFASAYGCRVEVPFPAH